MGVFGVLDSFPGRIVGQAQDNNISLVDDGLLGVRVFPFYRVDLDEFDIGSNRQSLMNLQSGCSGLPVYEYTVHF